MAKFLKRIVSAGKHLVSNGKGGRREDHITVDRLKKWASTANRMIDSGLRVPAPWCHVSKEGKVAVPVMMDGDGASFRSDMNAGWWDKFTVQDGGLYGILDVPGDKDDPNTPAYKVGKTVKDTSVFVQPRYVDGRNKTWGEDGGVLLHAALVTHPVESGQENFETLAASIPLEGDNPIPPLVLSAQTLVQSTIMADDSTVTKPPEHQGDNFSITDVIQSLSDVGIVLPDDTTTANLAERLVIVLKQKAADDKEGQENSSVTTPPSNSKTQPAPVAMSTQTTDTTMSTQNDDQVKKLKEELEDSQKQVTLLMSLVGDQRKSSLVERLKSLVDSGRIAEEYAEKVLAPQLEKLQMSIGEDGTVSKTPVEQVIEALEKSAPGKSPLLENMMMGDTPEGTLTHSNDDLFGDGSPDLSKDQIDEFVEMAN